jgi:hypothetical protein
LDQPLSDRSCRRRRARGPHRGHGAGAGAPPPQERPAAIARLEKELEQLQRVEEALITAAAERSEVVARSHDVPPWVLLGVRVAEKPKRAAE